MLAASKTLAKPAAAKQKRWVTSRLGSLRSRTTARQFNTVERFRTPFRIQAPIEHSARRLDG